MIASAVKRFVEMEKRLPVEGLLPDMFSDSARYLLEFICSNEISVSVGRIRIIWPDPDLLQEMWIRIRVAKKTVINSYKNQQKL